MNTRDNGVRPDQITVTVNMQNNTHLGLLAAREWLARADARGLRMSVWAQTGAANRVGPEGGKIAELSSVGSWHVVLDNTGHVAAHQGSDWDCTTCDELRQAGKLPARTKEVTQYTGPSSGGISAHRSPFPGQQLTSRGSKLQPGQRAQLLKDIAELREQEPGISKTEIGRRMAVKYGISAATVVRQYI